METEKMPSYEQEKKALEIEKLRAKLAKLRARKLEAERRSAYWLMTANEIDEKQISWVRFRLRELGVEWGE